MILQVSPLGWEALVIALLALLGCLVQPCSAAGQHGGTAGPLNGLIYPGPWLGQWGLFCPMRPLIQQAHLGLFSTRAKGCVQNPSKPGLGTGTIWVPSHPIGQSESQDQSGVTNGKQTPPLERSRRAA